MLGNLQLLYLDKEGAKYRNNPKMQQKSNKQVAPMKSAPLKKDQGYQKPKPPQEMKITPEMKKLRDVSPRFFENKQRLISKFKVLGKFFRLKTYKLLLCPPLK